MNVSTLTRQSRRAQRTQGDAYLKFQLAQETHALIGMKHVQEVLILPLQRLTPMPNMPSHVMGLMNRRSRVMWVVDLAQMLALPGVDANTQHYNLMIIRVGAIALGLTVQQIDGIAWLSPDRVQSPPSHVDAAMVAYLRGCILQDGVLLVLDAEAIAQAATVQSN